MAYTETLLGMRNFVHGFDVYMLCIVQCKRLHPRTDIHPHVRVQRRPLFVLFMWTRLAHVCKEAILVSNDPYNDKSTNRGMLG